MKKETVKLTKGSMQLVDENSFASVKFAEATSDGQQKPTLEMVGYSGGIIKGHWYWGDLAIDLAGMKFPKAKFPILMEHDIDRKIAFATKMSIENNQLTVEKSEFVDTPESLQFREQSAQGFPFEASIYAKPTKIQTLQENEVADVNGYQMKGPGTIWRNSSFKEVSVCVFGYDSNTSSAAMAESEEVCITYTDPTEALTQQEEEKSMDFTKFKTEHPDEFAKLAAEVIAGEEAKFTEEKAALTSQIATLTAENTKLSEESKDSEKRLLALEKAEAIRTEAQLKYTADAIFAAKFKESGLPERLSEKVKRLVSHDQFVKESVLDTEGFSAAVDAELKDWTEEQGDSGSVLGLSTSSKDHGETDTSKLSKAADEAADRMLASLKIK